MGKLQFCFKEFNNEVQGLVDLYMKPDAMISILARHLKLVSDA